MTEYHDPWRPRNDTGGPGVDPGHADMFGTAYHVPHRLHGQGIERMFPSGGYLARPFSAGPSNLLHYLGKGGREQLHETIYAAIRGEIHPENVDPRWLKMTQSAVVSPGVRYYSEDPTYQKTGQTYANQEQAGNRFPVVLQHEGSGQRLILSGHHRAAAALLLGKPLKALVVHR